MMANQNLSTEQLGADLMTFEGFMGDYRKIFPADWFQGEKSMQRNSWEKQYPALKKILLMTYSAEKNSYSIMWGEELTN